MRVDDARALFDNIPKVARALEALHEAGLGYVALGQSSTTLSGGEAQRVKLAGRARPGRHRPDPLHPRRADHRPALRRRRRAARRPPPPGRPGQHPGRHRAQPRRDPDRRLGHRPRPRGGRRRREISSPEGPPGDRRDPRERDGEVALMSAPRLRAGASKAKYILRSAGGGPVVHQAEVEAGGDLADLVAVVAVDPGGPLVVEDHRGAAVEPARAGVDVALDGPDAEEPVDRRWRSRGRRPCLARRSGRRWSGPGGSGRRGRGPGRRPCRSGRGRGRTGGRAGRAGGRRG